MSDQTSSDFAEVIEWASEQPWSSGKVGLLGISYYGGSQWRVAARKPKGLTCIIPWEGESPQGNLFLTLTFDFRECTLTCIAPML